MRAAVLPCIVVLSTVPAAAQNVDVDAGRRTFEARCGRCHAADGTGTEMGPNIQPRLKAHEDSALAAIVRDGIPQRGMPPNPMSDAELASLIRFLRGIQRDPEPALVARAFRTTDGRGLDGLVTGEGLDDLQLRTADGRVHLLRRAGGELVREVTSGTPWPAYNGDPRGNRYTTLTEIDRHTLPRLAPKWMFTLPDTGALQVTPIVVDGIMYVTAVNEVYALDAGSGRQIWHFKRDRTKGATAWANRGVALAGDRVFLTTDNAHLVALNRWTGALVWESALADIRDNYFASSAPLTAGTLVITGVGGGEHGANGFVAAFDQESGHEAWRFWTVPRPGEPGADTWRGSGPADHRGAPTWFTGSYDPDLDLVYWPVGNPSQEYNGDDRQGDNLYANSILALDRKTGRLKWYYQFTPHDLWDWDATQTSVLVDAEWQGRPRRLLLHASRNGFFYVFDRADGTLLLAKPFVRNLTWATGIGQDGRPILVPGQEPSEAGTKVCPSQDGATNWFSPSYSPQTGLFYLQTFEKCSVYTKTGGGVWESGKPYLGGSQKTAPDPVPQRVLKAIDIRSGAIKWELPQPGPATTWAGTLATATGLVFFGDESGAFVAADAVTGKPLWSFAANAAWKASPMTYAFDGHQFIAVAANSTIVAFGLE